MFTTDGSTHPSTINRVLWGGLVGLLSSLLLITGGLDALQNFVVLLGFPIAFVIDFCVSSDSLSNSSGLTPSC